MKQIAVYVFLAFAMCINAQTIYVDVLTAPAMAVQGQILKSQQERTNTNLNSIERAQMLVFTQMHKANEYHNKVVKGLTEVSAVLHDAYIVRDIYASLSRLLDNTKKISSFVAKNPQYSIFAIPSVDQFNQRMQRLTLEVTQILTSGDHNMMNSGQRRELLNDISMQTRLLAAQAWNILYSMESSQRIGFWNALNPFRTWVNNDVRIMKDIIRRSKYL